MSSAALISRVAKQGLEGTQFHLALFMQGQSLIAFPLHQRNMRLSLVGAVPLPQNSVSRTHRESPESVRAA